MAKQVSKEEFWVFINRLTVDVRPQIRGSYYPYTSVFRTPNGVEYGRIVGKRHSEDRLHPVSEEYFIADQQTGEIEWKEDGDESVSEAKE